VAHGRVDLHRIDTESAVAIDRDHLAIRRGEGSRNTKRHADTKTAKNAGIEIGAGTKADPGEAQQVTAIGDRDVGRINNGCDRLEDFLRMDFAILAKCRGGAATCGSLHLLFLEARCPVFVECGSTIAGSGHQCIQR